MYDIVLYCIRISHRFCLKDKTFSRRMWQKSVSVLVHSQLVMQEGKGAGSRLSRLGGSQNVMVSKRADKGRAWSMRGGGRRGSVPGLGGMRQSYLHDTRDEVG